MGLGAYLGNGGNRLNRYGRYVMAIKYAPLWNKLDGWNTDEQHKAEDARVYFVNECMGSIIEHYKKVYGEPTNDAKIWMQQSLEEFIGEFE